jgi:uncharacterized membrane protein YdjX (TVP38/TMEM64 family)
MPSDMSHTATQSESDNKTSSQTNDRSTSRVLRIVAVLVWLVVYGVWEWWHRSRGLSYAAALQHGINGAKSHWWAPVLFIITYLLRPLILFPASLLTIAGGVLFGPIAGVLLTVLAANGSALVSYAMGRWFRGGDRATDHRKNVSTNSGLVARWGNRLREQSFETVLVMRLLALPYDAVNLACGVLRVRIKPFLLATAIGSLPGTVAFVLIGASLERVDQGFRGINRIFVVASILIIALSIALSQILRRRRS